MRIINTAVPQIRIKAHFDLPKRTVSDSKRREPRKRPSNPKTHSPSDDTRRPHGTPLGEAPLFEDDGFSLDLHGFVLGQRKGSSEDCTFQLSSCARTCYDSGGIWAGGIWGCVPKYGMAERHTLGRTREQRERERDFSRACTRAKVLRKGGGGGGAHFKCKLYTHSVPPDSFAVASSIFCTLPPRLDRGSLGPKPS